MSWAEVTGRVVVEACGVTADDVVLYLGDDAVAAALAAGPGVVIRRDDLDDPPTGVTIVCLHGWLRRRPPDAQRAAFRAVGRLLATRGLLVVGDVMWSLPPDQIDAPEQFGDALEHAPTTASVEAWAREAGFLPDTHRFGLGAAVLVALRA
jgi:hypothetical protein